LNGDIVLKVVVLLAVLKIVATAVCYASGNAGGIFGPSLFIGAMMGAAVGGAAHALFPGSTAGPGAYALVGMGTAFAGIVRTPLTSVFMIFEITRDYTIVVPLMISNMIAFFISQKLQKQPIYEALSDQEGVHLPAGAGRSPDGRLQVRQAMRSAPPVIRTDLEIAVHVHPDHSLSLALERMGASGLNVLPVVSRANVRQSIGTIALDDILAAYGVAEPGGGQPE
jgi:CIC family chloride channel protein